MKIFRYTVISTVILLLFCNVGLTAERSPKATTPLQTLPVQKSPTVPKPGTQKMIALPSKITVSDVTLTVGQSQDVKVKIGLTDSKGNPLQNKFIKFGAERIPGEMFPGVQLVKTDRGGRAQVSFNYYTGPWGPDFGIRAHTVTSVAKFEGDATAPSGRGTGKITVGIGLYETVPPPYHVGQRIRLEGVLSRAKPDGSLGDRIPNQRVKVFVTGVAPWDVFTDDKGRFFTMFDIPVTATGMFYKFTFSYPGDDWNASCVGIFGVYANLQ
jgi:hypothetical protein